jgi:tRNA A37 threonylcarbamoyladenosine dehydratase
MEHDESVRRFSGIAALYGTEGLSRLMASHVCVIGTGGVGSWVAEALARSAIGSITLIDMDHVTPSNINRQLVALESTRGMAKVRVLAGRIGDINPDARVDPIEEFVTHQRHAALLDRGYDMVVDCIDNYRDKAAIIAWCSRQRVPVITIGGTGGKTDPTRLRLLDLSRTEMDPLLSRVRKELRQRYDFPRNPKRRFSIPAVFSLEQTRQPVSGGECETIGAPEATHLHCGGLGSVMHVTASAGLMAVSRVLEKLTTEASGD